MWNASDPDRVLATPFTPHPPTSQRYPSLSVRDDPFTHNDGRVTRLLRAEGTVPIYYQGVKYNIPVSLFLPETFPRVGPIVYVTPTANMIIKPGHGLVDGGGLVSRDPSGGWRYPASSLREYAKNLAEAFGVEPPLFAKPVGYDESNASIGSSHNAYPNAIENSRWYPISHANGGGNNNGAPRGDAGPHRQSHGGRNHPPPASQTNRDPPRSRYPSPPREHQPGLYPPPPSVSSDSSRHAQTRESNGGRGLPPPPPPGPPPGEHLDASGRASDSNSYGRFPGSPYGTPTPPPGVRLSSSSPTQRDGGGRALAEATFKSRAVKALTKRLKLELDVVQTVAQREAERLLGTQASLAQRREVLEGNLRELRGNRGRWEARVGSLRAATVSSEEWLAGREKRSAGGAPGKSGGDKKGESSSARDATASCDLAFVEDDGLSLQLLRAVSKDAALEDAMDALDEGLDKGALTLPEWLKATRQLSKEQFMARAETLVVRKTQMQRGVSGGLTFKNA
jgi:ESCRT-I complex subunit TSG101